MGSRERGMTKATENNDLTEKSQRLLQGPLKHARTAALAVSLVPLAAVGVGTVDTNELCFSAGICGVVFYDSNNNGIQDPTEPGIEGAVVTISGDRPTTSTSTNSDGVYYFPVPDGDYKIEVQIPPGTQPSPSDVGDDDHADSDGVPDGFGNSTTTVKLTGGEDSSNDFGFWTPPVAQPGTGTPGYWKNHPEAWPVATISVGGIVYTKAEAISWLDRVGKDRTTTMFSSLVPAMLNVLVGNDSSCIASTITAANQWMADHGPVGSGVHAASLAWKLGEPLHRQLDNYNNGMLCAPHRD